MKNRWQIFLRHDEYRIGRKRWWGTEWYREEYWARHLAVFVTDSIVVAKQKYDQILEEEEKETERDKSSWTPIGYRYWERY